MNNVRISLHGLQYHLKGNDVASPQSPCVSTSPKEGNSCVSSQRPLQRNSCFSKYRVPQYVMCREVITCYRVTQLTLLFNEQHLQFIPCFDSCYRPPSLYLQMCTTRVQPATKEALVLFLQDWLIPSETHSLPIFVLQRIVYRCAPHEYSLLQRKLSSCSFKTG